MISLKFKLSEIIKTNPDYFSRDFFNQEIFSTISSLPTADSENLQYVLIHNGKKLSIENLFDLETLEHKKSGHQDLLSQVEGEVYFYVKEHFIQTEHLWIQITTIINWLYGKKLIQSKKCYLDYFIGRYKTTSHGLHKEITDVFFINIEGKKTMELIAEDAIESREQFPVKNELVYTLSPIHDKVLKSNVKATTFELSPGDCLYWKAGTWHRSNQELNETFSISLNWIDQSKSPLKNQGVMLRAPLRSLDVKFSLDSKMRKSSFCEIDWIESVETYTVWANGHKAQVKKTFGEIVRSKLEKNNYFTINVDKLNERERLAMTKFLIFLYRSRCVEITL